MINGANPSDQTLVRACHSGNEEILQMLEEKGFKFTMDSLDSAISGWRNSLAWKIIEKIEDGSTQEERVNLTLIQASRYSNFSMMLSLIDKGANVNAKINIC